MRMLKRLWLKLLIGLYYKDPRASRALLIGASTAWASWLFTPGDALATSRALQYMSGLLHEEWIAAAIPLLLSACQVAVTFPRLNRYRLLADFSASTWWVFLTISYFLSNPLAPTIGVYIVLTVFSLWIVWRDTNPKPYPLLTNEEQ